MTLSEELQHIKITSFTPLYTYKAKRQIGAIAKLSYKNRFYEFHGLRLYLAKAGFLSIDFPCNQDRIAQTKKFFYSAPLHEYKLAIEKHLIDLVKPLLDKEILDYIGEDTSTEEPIDDEDFFED